MVIIKKAGAKTPAGDMSLSRLSIKKLSIVVYNYAALSIFCQEQNKNKPGKFRHMVVQ